VVEIDVPDTAGQPAAPPKILTQDIPPETAASIATAANAIAQTLKEVVIPPAPPPTPPAPPAPPPPDVPTPATPQVTPGAGL
jgi:protein TonB